jgi:hypothetical protein
MPLNRRRRRYPRIGVEGSVPAVRGKWLVGNVIKFPDDGRIVRFGRAEGDESATIIILPVVRIERYAEGPAEGAEPRTPPPAESGGRRRVRRR